MWRSRLRIVIMYVGATALITSGLTLAIECNEDEDTTYDDGSVGDTGCRETNHSPICSDRGTCVCGECQCNERNNPDEKVSGQFCECTNFMCPRVNGMICGGIGRGKCDCNVCRCYPGWGGVDCTCNKGTDDCMNPDNGKICSRNGKCECNQCKCYEGYNGKYCEDCPTCPGNCINYKECVQCQVFKTANLTDEQCITQCIHFNATIVTRAVPGKNDRLCTFFDDNDCRFKFVYGYGDNKKLRVQVENHLECPPPTHGHGYREDGVARNESSFLVFLSVITVIMYLCNM